jgi:purine-binding chemotaxis protein CheW
MIDVIDAAPGRVVSTHSEQEFLSFKLGSEEYGIDIQQVQELRSYEAVTKIANTPDYIKGVVNSRGIIVPIIDLRLKFQTDTVRYDEFTVVIIINLNGKLSGIVVDSVSDVVRLQADQIQPPSAPSALDQNSDADYLLGLGTLDERMLIVVDIRKMIATNELNLALSSALMNQTQSDTN